MRASHPMFSNLSESEIIVRKVPPSLSAAVKAMVEAHPENRIAIGDVLNKKLEERYTKAESIDPQPMPKIIHVASGREVELLDSHNMGPWAVWTCKFPDGTIRSCTADEFLAAPGSTTMTTAKVQKSASRGFRAGDRVRCLDGRIGKVRDNTRNGETLVDFPNGSLAILRDHEISPA